MRLREGTAQEAGMSPERVDKLRRLPPKWVDQGVHPALVATVARRGIVVVNEACGQLTPEPDAPPVRLDTVFNIASISKVITATATMILVEEGRLSLTRSVSEYIPEFRGEGKDEIKVHHLLTHTSGMNNEEYYNHVHRRRQSTNIPAAAATQHPIVHEYLYLGYDMPVSRAPGSEMSYFDYGFELLGEIIRRVSGMSLADFTQERIFKPLGMDETHYGLPHSLRDRLIIRAPDAVGATTESPGYRDQPQEFKAMWGGLNSRERQERPWASAGVFSTAQDMAIFGKMFLNGGIYDSTRILSPVTVSVMTRNQIPGVSARFFDEHFSEACWGYGWSVRGSKRASVWGEPLFSARTFCHGGGGGTFLAVDPVNELVLVYFSVVREIGKLNADLFINATVTAIEEV